MKFLAISYCKICSDKEQIPNRKINEERLLTLMSCFIPKSPIFDKGNNGVYIYTREVLLCYCTLVGLINIFNTLFAMQCQETCSFFRVDRCARKSGHLCHRVIG